VVGPLPNGYRVVQPLPYGPWEVTLATPLLFFLIVLIFIVFNFFLKKNSIFSLPKTAQFKIKTVQFWITAYIYILCSNFLRVG
jgi:hypothetical protein